METMINDTDKRVAEYFKEQCISFSVVLARISNNRDNWECDSWVIFINGESFEHHTGTGHRNTVFGWNTIDKEGRAVCELVNGDYKELCKKTKELKRNPNKRATVYEAHSRTCPPTQASVLYGLILDSGGVDQSFNNWCSDYGYDNDSIKAQKIYFACQENSDKLHKALSHEQIKTIEEMLKDY